MKKTIWNSQTTLTIIVMITYLLTNIGIISSNSDDNELIKDQLKNQANNENTSRNSYALDTNKLQKLANSEIILYPYLREFLDMSEGEEKSEVNLTSVQSYLEDFESSSKMATHPFSINTSVEEKSDLIVKNPILMFRMISRLSLNYEQMKKDILKDSVKNAAILTKLESFEKGVNILPDEEDVNDAIHGLIRIQEVYDFNVKRFSTGKIGKFQTNATLRAVDCLRIGKFALENRAVAIAIEWLVQSLKLASAEDFVKVNKKEINKHLKPAIYHHDQEWEDYQRAPLQLSAHLFTNKISDTFKTGLKMSTTIRKLVAGRRERSSADMEYQDLCAGRNFQPNEEKSKLKCWLEREKNPYWKISPLKMEQLHLDPELILIHDFIGDELIQKIQTASVPLRRSKVFHSVDHQGSKWANYRSSLTGWIDNVPENSFLLPMYKRIEFATGLKLIGNGSNEDLIVVDYSALGSYYGVHRDALTGEILNGTKDGGGNRIATFMIYLNDVQLGGSTAFPIMGTYSKPKKGSALLWYNLYKNGTVDLRTMHAGCPTVLGRKQIANNWILSHENMFNRKCTLNPMD